jgi:hypothetical protein
MNYDLGTFDGLEGWGSAWIVDMVIVVLVFVLFLRLDDGSGGFLVLGDGRARVSRRRRLLKLESLIYVSKYAL